MDFGWIWVDFDRFGWILYGFGWIWIHFGWILDGYGWTWFAVLQRLPDTMETDVTVW